jgi:DNA replication licensing factor MCM3
MFFLEPDHTVTMLSIIFSLSFRNPGEQDGEALPMGSSVEMLSTQNPDLVEVESVNTPIYEKYDPLLHGGTRTRKYVCTSALILKL